MIFGVRIDEVRKKQGVEGKVFVRFIIKPGWQRDRGGGEPPRASPVGRGSLARRAGNAPLEAGAPGWKAGAGVLFGARRVSLGQVASWGKRIKRTGSQRATGKGRDGRGHAGRPLNRQNRACWKNEVKGTAPLAVYILPASLPESTVKTVTSWQVF